MGVLANVFEQAGLATVGISLVRGQAESTKPPRMLHCEFPLGRPLGKPNDPAFQTEVLRAALALIERTDSPVLEDFPTVIEDEAEEPASCPIPPRHDPDLHPAIDEARGLRKAYDRNLEATGRTLMGRIGGPDDVTGMIESFLRIENGETLDEVGLADGRVIALGQDLRAYYEEAGLQLADNTGARALESWFYRVTETGQLIRRAQAVMKEEGTGDDLSITYVLPLTQSTA